MLIRPHTVHPSASADRRQLAVQCSGTLADRGARLHNNPPVRQTNQHADHALGWRSDFTEQYVRGIQIGKGAYGSVYEATPLRHVGGEAEPVAVKILSKQDGSAKVLRRLTREADALEALTHVPGVVHLHGKYEGPTYAMLVTQLLAGCDLLALRKALGGRLKELQLAFVARQMLTVLAGVHEAGWCHGDCKPSNWIARAGLKKRLVLLEQGKLDAAAYQEPWVYAIDFGSASRLPSAPTARLRRRTGTPVYQAPELIRRSYDARADVWSTGMVLYQLWAKRLPFWPTLKDARLASVEDVHRAVLEGVLDFQGDCWQRDLSPQGLRFMQALLSRDPDARPTAAAALQHPWLTDLQPIRPPVKHAVEAAKHVVEAAPEGINEGGNEGRPAETKEQRKERKSTFRRMQITWSWS